MGFSLSGLADINYVCSSGGSERLIDVVYAEADATVPCEVQYNKEGLVETLWRAQNEANYCEAKAASFIKKLEGWGWGCSVVALEQSAVSETVSVADPATASMD